MGKIEAKLKESDAIIMGAPSYFGSIPAIIKDIIDRSRPMKMAGYQIKDKIFSAYATAGLQGGGVNAVQDDLIHFALIQGMMVVGGLGHPVLIPNLVSETLQMQEVKAFRKPTEIGDVAKNSIESLAERIYLLLVK
jgi:multimeric flavodoxin WrbA